MKMGMMISDYWIRLSYDLNNYGDRGGCYRPWWIAPSEICMSLDHTKAKSNNCFYYAFKIIPSLTRNNQRRQRSKVKILCSIAVLCVSFTWWIGKTRVIRLRVIEGLNAWDQIVFCAFHWFLVKSKRMLATYMRRIPNNNLEIRIAGSSCRPQKQALNMLTYINRSFTCFSAWHYTGFAQSWKVHEF